MSDLMSLVELFGVAFVNKNEWYLLCMISEQTQSIFKTFIQCWTNIEDVVPPLYKCYTNVLCLPG